MNRIFIIFSFIFATTHALGQRGIIETLNQLNSFASIPRSPNQCIEGEETPEARACAIALCGQPEEALIAQVNDRNFDLYVESGTKKRLPELEAPVREIFSKRKKEADVLIKAIEARLSSETPLLDYKDWTYQYSYFLHIVYGDYINFEIDNSKPEEERLNVTLSPPEGSSETFLKGLRAYAADAKRSKEADEFWKIEEGFYSLEVSKSLIKKAWEEFFSEFDSQISSNPNFMSSSKEEIDKLRTEFAVESNDPYELGRVLRQLRDHERNLRYEARLPLSHSPYIDHCGSQDCREGIKEYLGKTNFPDLLAKYKKKVSEQKLDDYIKGCQAEFINLGFKKSDKEKFQRHLPETKRAFLDKVFRPFSSHSKEAFSSYLENDLNLSYLNHKPNEQAAFMDRLLVMSQEESQAPSENTEFLLIELLNLRSLVEKTGMVMKFRICNNYPPFAAWDAFGRKGNVADDEAEDADPNKDNVFVSLFSCTHEAAGKGVFSHELGHALSYVFQEKKLSQESLESFLRTRKCVTASHRGAKEDTSRIISYSGDSLYTEEDTADLLSFVAIDPNDSLYTCALLETTSDGTDYMNLSLENSYAEDPHSSSLLRVLREAVYKKKPLPKACKELIEKNKDKYRVEPCA